MKVVIFTFSGTGNTWWVVNAFKEIAKQKGVTVKAFSIENLINEKSSFFTELLKQTDVLGIAYPIYGSTWPRIMEEFTIRLLKIYESMPVKEQLPPVLVLTSMMIFSGDGALVPRKHFVKQGFSLKWAVNIALTSNISIPCFRFNPYPKEKLEENKGKAVIKLGKLLEKILVNESWLEHQFNLPYRFMAWLQRVTEPLWIKSIKFSVDKGRCTLCKQCINYCPTNNITYNKDDDCILFNNDCTACMRCYNLCPVYAVKLGKKVSLPPKYKRLKPIMKGFNYADIHKR